MGIRESGPVVPFLITASTTNVWLSIGASLCVIAGAVIALLRAINKVSKKFDKVDEVGTKVDALTTQVADLKTNQDAIKTLVDKELQHNGGGSIKDLAKRAAEDATVAKDAALDARHSANAAVSGLDQFTKASVGEHQLLWRAIYEGKEKSA